MNQTDSNDLLYASLYTMHKWVRGELSNLAHPLFEGMYALDYLSRQAVPGEPLDTDRLGFYKVCSHGEHVKAVYELWAIAEPGVLPVQACLKAELEGRMRAHDLIK